MAVPTMGCSMISTIVAPRCPTLTPAGYNIGSFQWLKSTQASRRITAHTNGNTSSIFKKDVWQPFNLDCTLAPHCGTLCLLVYFKKCECSKPYIMTWVVYPRCLYLHSHSLWVLEFHTEKYPMFAEQRLVWDSFASILRSIAKGLQGW